MNEKIISLFLAGFTLPLTPSQAKDLGNFGQTFTISEVDLLEQIQSRLSSLEADGSLLEHQQKIAQKTKEGVERPHPVEGVAKTQKARGFTFDPSITVPYDLKDHQGRIFQKKGEKVNPLDQVVLSKTLVFFDGDDPVQQAWVMEEIKESQEKFKLILVKGAPLELMEQWRIPVYFDQSGVLCKKLGIRHVPARVSQKDKHLQVEEILLDPNGAEK